MAIKDEMYKMIENEINRVISNEQEKILVDVKKTKIVAKMLTDLSVSKDEADILVSQYMSNIKNICNSKLL